MLCILGLISVTFGCSTGDRVPVRKGGVCGTTTTTCANSNGLVAGATEAKTVSVNGREGEELTCSANTCESLRDHGEPCTTDNECLDKSCHQSTCQGFRRVLPGGSCSSNSACSNGYCNNNNLCILYANVGEPCSPAVVPLQSFSRELNNYVTIPSNNPLCHPGFFTTTSSTELAFRNPRDPERSVSTAPLYCMTVYNTKTAAVTGVCRQIVERGNENDCIAPQNLFGLTPLLKTPVVVTSLPVTPGLCERGTYPRLEDNSTLCSCRKFVKFGGECRFTLHEGIYRTLDECRYGSRCVVTEKYLPTSQLISGKCVEFVNGAVNVKYYTAPGEADFNRQDVCPSGSVFNPIEELCETVTSQVTCDENSDCVSGICDVQCGDKAVGVCVAANGICTLELREALSYLYDRAVANRSVVASPYGAFAGTLKVLSEKSKTQKNYLCCLHDTVATSSLLYTTFGLRDLDLSETCSSTTSPFTIILSSICGAVGFFSFAVILIQDIVPSSRAASVEG